MRLRSVFWLLGMLVGSVAAQTVQEGLDAYEKGDYATALQHWQTLAEQGNDVAQYNLGYLYESGHGVALDLTQAARWYQQAAEQGEVDGQFRLGRLYDEGLGLTLDDAAAARWYRLAADQGHAQAQFNLAQLIAAGNGLEQDAALAVDWYRKAAEQKHAAAQTQLALAYQQGVGVAADQGQAILWFRKAADQGDAAALSALQAIYTPLEDPFNGQLKDPRPASAVLDQANLLNSEDRAVIEAYATKIWQQTDGELLVVSLPTIGGSNPREYATQMFNKLRIGDAGSDRGILLLVAVQDRKAELILGTGLDSAQGRNTAQRIMDQHFTPNMRAGKASQALRETSAAAAHQLLQLPVPEAPPGASAATAVPVTRPRAYSPPATSTEPSALHEEPVVQAAAGGGLGLAGLAALRAWWRRRPRKCTTCRIPMQRLSEAADDAHLSTAERAEEKISSVDYDIWHCSSCAQVLKLRYGALFTRYKACPSCAARTKSSTSTTLIAATEGRGGRVRVDEQCAHCNWRHSSTHDTPRITRSSSSSSGRSGGSSSSRRSGGGRSSGGGGSSSW